MPKSYSLGQMQISETEDLHSVRYNTRHEDKSQNLRAKDGDVTASCDTGYVPEYAIGTNDVTPQTTVVTSSTPAAAADVISPNPSHHGTDNPGFESCSHQDTDVDNHVSALPDENPDWKFPMEVFTTKKQELRRRQHSSRDVKSYYTTQDQLISAYESISRDDGDVELSQVTSSDKLYKKAALLSKLSFALNIILVIGKVAASVLSGSIAIISSLVDSALDIFSGVVMLWATRAMRARDPYSYPQGRTKLESVAVIIISVVMAFASLEIIKESIMQVISLAGQTESSLPVVDLVTLLISGGTVVCKLLLWLACRKVNSSVVQALSQDHRNDVVSNTVAIVCGFLGSSNFQNATGIDWMGYVDPAGAMAMSVYIVVNWWQTGREHIKMLTGYTAEPEFISKLTWVSINHHEKILKIDTVRAFHFGNNFLVEVDIVLPMDMQLEEAHDIGESLQHRLESLEGVERAFVHLDYEYSHNPRTEHKVV